MACRICFEPEDLVRVCGCEGSVRWVHLACAQRWIDVSYRSTCELCLQPFAHPNLRRPVHTKHAFEWAVFGMFVGFSHAFVEWFVTLAPEHELLYKHDTTAIVAAGFNALVVFSIVLLWRVRQRAKPLIVTYFTTFLVSDGLCHLMTPEPIPVFLFVAELCLFVFVWSLDYAVFQVVFLPCNALHQGNSPEL